MYKVVIVDDEPIIVEGLSRVIKWKYYDCQIVGTAFDGKEGLELIEKEETGYCFYRYCNARYARFADDYIASG